VRSRFYTCVDEKGRLTAAPTVARSSGTASLDEGALKLAKAGSGPLSSHDRGRTSRELLLRVPGQVQSQEVALDAAAAREAKEWGLVDHVYSSREALTASRDRRGIERYFLRIVPDQELVAGAHGTSVLCRGSIVSGAGLASFNAPSSRLAVPEDLATVGAAVSRPISSTQV